MTPTKQELKDVIKEVFAEEVQPLFIERQKHYNEHQLVERLGHDDVDFLIASREFVNALKDTFWKTFMRVCVVAFFGVVTCGVIFYFKYKHLPPPPH